tara:strand:- start:1343 stop:1546 length:204 start_codon:yes stop_codon:yes gene_type:complete
MKKQTAADRLQKHGSKLGDATIGRVALTLYVAHQVIARICSKSQYHERNPQGAGHAKEPATLERAAR